MDHAARLESRKRWILAGSQAPGCIVVDHGAADAITRRGKSLLPIGVISTIACPAISAFSFSKSERRYEIKDGDPLPGPSGPSDPNYCWGCVDEYVERYVREYPRP